MTGLHSFDCKVGSYFGHRRVSQSPPVIPDGRSSPVRFEVAAARPYVFRPLFKSKLWFGIRLSGNAFTHSLASYVSFAAVPTTPESPGAPARVIALPTIHEAIVNASLTETTVTTDSFR